MALSKIVNTESSFEATCQQKGETKTSPSIWLGNDRRFRKVMWSCVLMCAEEMDKQPF